MQVRDHITLETTCNTWTYSKSIEFNYLVVDALSPYNVVLGRSAINLLWGDHESALECYQSSLVIRNKDVTHEASIFPQAHATETASWDLRLVLESETLTPTKYLKEVQISPLVHQVTNIGSFFMMKKRGQNSTKSEGTSTYSLGVPLICPTYIPYWCDIAMTSTYL